MNNNTLKGNWKYVKGEFRRTWGALTEDDLEKTQGNAEALIGLLQRKVGMAQDEARRKFTDFIETLDSVCKGSLVNTRSSGNYSSTKTAVRH